MSPVTGRIALIAYVLGAMLIPWTHYHPESVCGTRPTSATAAGCSCSSNASVQDSCQVFSSPTASGLPQTAEVSQGSDSDSCGDACSICAFLESFQSEAIQPQGHHFELIASRCFGHLCCDFPREEPLSLIAPRGPPVI